MRTVNSCGHVTAGLDCIVTFLRSYYSEIMLMVRPILSAFGHA